MRDPIEVWDEAAFAPKFTRAELATLSAGWRALITTLAVQGHTDGDGFLDSLVDVGNSFEEAANGWDRFGFPALAEFVRAIAALAGGPLPDDRDERTRLIEGLADDVQSRLDEASYVFYQLREAHSSLTTAFETCFSHHPDEFALPDAAVPWDPAASYRGHQQPES